MAEAERAEMTEIFEFRQGRVPLLVSMPHVGTELPADIAGRLTDEARALPDTDWHLPLLYAFLDEIGASVIVARVSRYVIDLNRPPDDTPLYASATTGLCPSVLFDGQPLYRPGAEPDEAERRTRLDAYWRPYHRRSEAELTEMRRRQGVAVLFDAHSIRSVVPRLFEGRLPDLNIGTADGASAAPELTARLVEVAQGAGDDDFDHVLNGRFKGGYITRRYGRPEADWHAVQLELSQRTYMDETGPPFAFREEHAARIRPHLRRWVETLAAFAVERAAGRPP
jgi:N-formylglutamate deformylase